MRAIARALVAGALAGALALPGWPGSASADPAPPGPPSSTAAVPGLPAPGAPVSAAGLAALTARVDALTARASAAAAALELASARDMTLRVDYDRALMARYQARRRLAAAVRRAYENYQGNPLSALLIGLSPQDVPAANLAARNTLGVDRTLLVRVSAAGSELAKLRAGLDAARRRLLAPALAAETALDQARGVLAYESAVYGAAQALAARQAQLAALSAQVTDAVAVTATPTQLATAAQQAPVLAALVAAGPAIPAGYTPTSETLAGIASWYGPGFIGSPTASGAPYDPAKLTCAMLAVPLGTVVHVSTGSHAVNCLVNDRGPYVAGRIIDMSEAGAAALDYTGIVRVQVTVLARSA